MVQIAWQSSVLFQIAGAMVGAAWSDHTGAMHSPRGTVQQPRPIRIQHRQVLSSRIIFLFLLLLSSLSLSFSPYLPRRIAARRKDDTLSSSSSSARVRPPVSRSTRARRQKHRRKNVTVFDGGLFQQLGANTAEERDSWLQALQLASYECMRSQLLSLRQRIEAFSGHKHDTDIQMLRLQRGTFTGLCECRESRLKVSLYGQVRNSQLSSK